ASPNKPGREPVHEGNCQVHGHVGLWVRLSTCLRLAVMPGGLAFSAQCHQLDWPGRCHHSHRVRESRGRSPDACRTGGRSSSPGLPLRDWAELSHAPPTLTHDKSAAAAEVGVGAYSSAHADRIWSDTDRLSSAGEEAGP